MSQEVLLSGGLDWTSTAEVMQRCLCTMLCLKAKSPSILSYKCSDFPVAKLTFADEAPPKPPRLFLVANSKESTSSPADSPVTIWANCECCLWMLSLLVAVLSRLCSYLFITEEICYTSGRCFISWLISRNSESSKPFWHGVFKKSCTPLPPLLFF